MIVFWWNIQVSAFLGNFCNIDHAAAHNYNLTVEHNRRINSLLDTGYVGCECCQNNAAFASPTACLIAGPTELSEPVVPGFSTFVESDNSANTPFVTELSKFVHIHQTAINWGLVNFKVPCMKNRPDWCIKVYSAGVRNGVICLDETNSHLTNLNFIAGSNRTQTFWRYLYVL